MTRVGILRAQAGGPENPPPSRQNVFLQRPLNRACDLSFDPSVVVSLCSSVTNVSVPGGARRAHRFSSFENRSAPVFDSCSAARDLSTAVGQFEKDTPYFRDKSRLSATRAWSKSDRRARTRLAQEGRYRAAKQLGKYRGRVAEA